jgi:hypothetical protein
VSAQVAIRTNQVGVLYLTDVIPLEVLFVEGGRIEPTEFVASWKATPEANEVVKSVRAVPCCRQTGGAQAGQPSTCLSVCLSVCPSVSPLRTAGRAQAGWPSSRLCMASYLPVLCLPCVLCLSVCLSIGRP